MRTLGAVCLWLALVSPTQALTNQLGSHPSPYLALHGDDPVAWQVWSESVFEKARQENKLVYVSVGYFSCHWCHVMQRESYRNPQIAQMLNRDFLPVKVDRELQPALDETLMDFVRKTQGRGGWPLNVFLTPEGYPLYAVLYLPPDSFAKVIRQLDAIWREDSEHLTAMARPVGSDDFPDSAGQVDPVQVASLGKSFEKMALSFADTFEGGFGDQSRFPHVPQLEYLLDRYQHRASAPVREVLKSSLDAMAWRGLRDHVDGGFFRYTVDPGWSQPHFEKMLYDNAQLASLYLRAGQVLQREDYIEVGLSTLDFMADHMLSDNGAMVASLSAIDAQGREGAYYLFDLETLQRTLHKDELEVLRTTWSLDGPAPFEEGYLLVSQLPLNQVANTLGRPLADVRTLLAGAMAKLRTLRRARGLPVDDKQLAGWNALALQAFVAASVQTGAARYANIARGIKTYLEQTLWRDGTLYRAIANDGPLGVVALADYAYLARAFLDFARWSQDSADFRLATEVAKAGWRDFRVANGWRREPGRALAESGLHEIFSDDSLPAPDAVLAKVSLQLARAGADPALSRWARVMLDRAYDTVAQDPFSHGSRLAALALAVSDGG